MKYKQLKQIIAMMLIFTMPLSLCSCDKEGVEEETVEESGVTTSPLATSDLTKEDSLDFIQTEETTNEDDSLETLRSHYKDSNVQFVTAYLGQVGGLFENSFEEDFPTWLKENNELLLKEYPFITSIDSNHIIGIMGYLYCVVPIDENATLAVNRVTWNEETQSEEVTEVLYRQETGEPILLFTNIEEEYYRSDREITVLDNQGNYCTVYLLGENYRHLSTCVADDNQCKWMEFSDYYYSDAMSLEDWMNEGWLGPTALGLAGDQSTGRGWLGEIPAGEDNRLSSYSLRFYFNEENGGSVDVHWAYEDGGLNEYWSGFWTIETEIDKPSRLTLSLSLVGGTNYDTTDGPVYMSETYPILISLRGTELLIGKGENGITLPFLPDNVNFCILSPSYG